VGSCIEYAQARLSADGSIALTEGLLARLPMKDFPLLRGLRRRDGTPRPRPDRRHGAGLGQLGLASLVLSLRLAQWSADLIRPMTERQLFSSGYRPGRGSASPSLPRAG
jgi:hypothetical protein